MIINFKNITLKNFMSFSEASIQLDNSGFTSIVGENNNKEDNAKSNGSGKSTISEAIVWCLTGDTLRGAKNVKKDGTSECVVTLNFSIDSDIYEITRYIPSKLQIIKNGEDISGKGIKASKEILEQELPDINVNLLSSIIILGQELPNRFSLNTPSGRKEVLEKLFKADFMIEDIKERIGDRLSTLKEEEREIEDTILANTSKANLLKENIKTDKENLDGLDNPIELTSKLDTLTEELKSVKTERDSIIENNSVITKNNNKITTEIVKIYDKKEEVKNDAFLEEEITKIKEAGTSLKNDIILLDKEIENKDNITDICPTCGQKLEGVEKPDTTEDKKKSMKMKEELDRLRTEYKELQAKRNEYIDEKLKKLDEEYNSLNAQIKEVQDTTSLDREIENLSSQVKEIENSRSVFNSKKEEIENRIKTNEETVKVLEENVNSDTNEKHKVSGRVDIANKINTLIKRDFRGYLLSNIIALLDTTFKEYTMEVVGHNNAEIKQDGNNILINFNNKPYENLSGGERRKVDICVQLALRAVLSKYNNFYSNIFIIDEVFDNLDSQSAEQIINLVINKVNCPTTYVISHSSDIETLLPIDNRIVIKKNNKESIVVQTTA